MIFGWFSESCCLSLLSWTPLGSTSVASAPSQGLSKTAPFFASARFAPRVTSANACILIQVYSFVPIPGAQQHKRPRRRYEEIERMYKCGWNGCEKAYGTLNHLNAHVTMQSHGAKRTPEGELDRFRCSVMSITRVPSQSMWLSQILDWVSAGTCALVSYTRSRGPAVARQPA